MTYCFRDDDWSSCLNGDCENPRAKGVSLLKSSPMGAFNRPSYDEFVIIIREGENTNIAIDYLWKMAKELMRL